MKFISIIIPAWKEEKVLEATLTNVSKIRYKDFEVIVVASKDRTLDIANQFKNKIKNYKILIQKPLGKNIALLDGIKATNKKTEVIVLLDADTLVKEDFIKEGLKGLENFDVANLDYFPINLNWISSFFMYKKILSRIIKKEEGLYGGGSIFLKKKIITKDMFDPSVRVGIDYNMYINLKKKNSGINFVKSTSVRTYLPSKFTEFIKQESRWLGAWTKLTKGISLDIAKSVIITLSLIGAFFNWLFGIPLYLYLIKLIIEIIMIYKKTRNIAYIKYSLSYIFLSIVYCFLTIYSLFLNKKTFKGERPK